MRIKGPIRRKRRARLVVEADVLASIGKSKFDVEAEPGHEYDLRNVEMKFLATLPRGLWRFLKAAAIIEEGVHNSALSPFDRDLSKHTWFKWGLWILKEGPLPQIPIKKRNYEEVRQEAQEALDAVGGELKYWYQQYEQLECERPDDPLFNGLEDIFKFDDEFNCFVTTDGDDTSFFDAYFANLYHCCSDREPDFKKIEPDILRLFDENWTTFAPDLGNPFDVLDARFREIVDWFCVKKNQSTQDKPRKPTQEAKEVASTDKATTESYANIDKSLKTLGTAPASVGRFVKAAELFAKGFKIAAVPPMDIETTRRPWITRALELMTDIGQRIDRETYKFGDANVPESDRKRMVKAFMSSFDSMKAWAQCVCDQHGTAPRGNRPQSLRFAKYVLDGIFALFRIDDQIKGTMFKVTREQRVEGFLFDSTILEDRSCEMKFAPTMIRELLGLCEVHQIEQGLKDCQDEELAKQEEEDRLAREKLSAHFDERYAGVDQEMKILSRLEPGLYRFNLLCQALTNGLTKAAEAPIDWDLENRLWISACLSLMTQDPLQGSGMWHDRSTLKQIDGGFLPAYEALIRLLSAFQDFNRDMLADELPYFIQEFNRIFGENYPGPDKTWMEQWLPYRESIVRKGANFRYEFSPRIISRLSQKCKVNPKVALNYYRNLHLTDKENGALLSQSGTNSPTTDQLYIQQCMSLTLDLGDYRKIVDAFNGKNPQRSRFAWLKRENIEPLFWPFYYFYFTPMWLRRFEIGADSVGCWNYMECYEKRKNVVNELLGALSRIIGKSQNYQMAKAVWDEVSGLFDVRLEGNCRPPTFDEQDHYEGKYIELIDAINACSDDVKAADMKPQGAKNARAKTVAHSTITATDANRYLYIEDASCIKVATPKGEQVFKFTRASEWEVVNRFTLSLSNGENNDEGHYPVKFTYMDSNRCKGECRAFLKRFTEQQPVAKKVRNRKYEDWARFKVELLGGKPFR